jgi:putative transposase
MDESKREQVALFRFSVIGTLISGELCHGDLKKRIRDLGGRRYLIPHSRKTRIAAGTIEDWLYAYRQKGLEGLKPKSRSDNGKLRQIDEQTGKVIIDYRLDHPRRPLRLIMEDLAEQKKIPEVLPLSTVYRYLRVHVPRHTRPITGKEQKRFCHRFPNDCWQGDVMHGPYIREFDGKACKTYLIAFIDDATRLITGAGFFYSEAAVNVKDVLRIAVLTYGVPSKLFLDNGKNFCSQDLEIACATMKCALIHSTAYYPEGKGKIERFFRTVRDSFLSAGCAFRSLRDINERFSHWLQGDYNRKPHGGLDGAVPLETYLQKAENRIRRLDAHIDAAELFCRKESRLVAHDGTFRVNNVLYETEEHLIGKKISVLYDKDDPLQMVKVYDGRVFVHNAKPIDFLSNAHAKRNELKETR